MTRAPTHWRTDLGEAPPLEVVLVGWFTGEWTVGSRSREQWVQATTGLVMDTPDVWAAPPEWPTNADRKEEAA